ncbi:hypothetical protein Drorol1_Dr00014854 [Drosera rotundifolia]
MNIIHKSFIWAHECKPFHRKQSKMEVKKVLHMTGGDGESSYSHICDFFMRTMSSMTEPLLEKAIQPIIQTDSTSNPLKLFTTADVGCGTGAAPFCFVSSVLDKVHRRCEELNLATPETQIYMNDLPGNDFNLLFKELSSYSGRCFLMGAPGSFHSRLFPPRSLHLVHSCYATHWLSQVPPGLYNEEGLPILNKGNIYISPSSSVAVGKAYLSQFEQDFSWFLNCRAVEVVANGCMILKLRGKASLDPLDEPFPTHVLSEAISQLISEGLIDEEKVDSFNFPFYYAAQEELQAIVEKEGSFLIEHIETVRMDVAMGIQDPWERAVNYSGTVKSFTQSLISHHFGQQVSDQIYDRLAHVVFDKMTLELAQNPTVFMVLRRKAN